MMTCKSLDTTNLLVLNARKYCFSRLPCLRYAKVIFVFTEFRGRFAKDKKIENKNFRCYLNILSTADICENIIFLTLMKIF